MPTFSAPGRAKRRFSQRNLPYTFLLRYQQQLNPANVEGQPPPPQQ